MNRTLEYYNSNASEYAASTVHADMSDLYAHFLPLIKNGAAILDLGCGSGRDSRFFLDSGYQVEAVDGSAELCKEAEKLLNQPVRNILFSQLDYREAFDAVWACATLLHVPKSDIQGIIAQTEAALKPEGILYMSFKYGNTERVDGDRSYSDYTEKDIPWLLEKSEFVCQEHWISQDVRASQKNVKWLNIICKKVEPNKAEND